MASTTFKGMVKSIKPKAKMTGIVNDHEKTVTERQGRGSLNCSSSSLGFGIASRRNAAPPITWFDSMMILMTVIPTLSRIIVRPVSLRGRNVFVVRTIRF
jgi:hypothetical protein